MVPSPDSAQISFPPPLAFLGTLLLALGIGGPGLTFRIFDDLGWLLAIAGLAVILTATGLFRAAGTAPEPWKPSSALVTDRVYRWTRNPMYLGMSATYIGIALIADNLLALILFVPLILVIRNRVILPEEAYMEARFGQAYRDYKAQVPRWIGRVDTAPAAERETR